MIELGSGLPAFSLRDTNRDEVTDETFRGAPAILAFFPMAFTGGWTNEMRGFQRVLGELEHLGARVAGVSADTFAALGAFAEQHGIEFPLLSDWPELATIDAFGARREGSPVAQRLTFVFDASGTLQRVIDDQEDMQAHSQQALAAVQGMAAD